MRHSTYSAAVDTATLPSMTSPARRRHPKVASTSISRPRSRSSWSCSTPPRIGSSPRWSGRSTRRPSRWHVPVPPSPRYSAYFRGIARWLGFSSSTASARVPCFGSRRCACTTVSPTSSRPIWQVPSPRTRSAPLDAAVAGIVWFGAIHELVVRWLVADRPVRLEESFPELRLLLLRSVGVPEDRIGALALDRGAR